MKRVAEKFNRPLGKLGVTLVSVLCSGWRPYPQAILCPPKIRLLS